MNETARDRNERAVRGRRGRSALIHAVLLVFAVLFFLPILWMASTSLKPHDQTMTLPPTWVPRATVAVLDGESKIVVREKKNSRTERDRGSRSGA